jgi:hypothetical protein
MQHLPRIYPHVYPACGKTGCISCLVLYFADSTLRIQAIFQRRCRDSRRCRLCRSDSPMGQQCRVPRRCGGFRERHRRCCARAVISELRFAAAAIAPASASSSKDGLVIDLSHHFNYAIVDPEKRTVRVGAGNLWSTVEKETIQHALFVAWPYTSTQAAPSSRYGHDTCLILI